MTTKLSRRDLLLSSAALSVLPHTVLSGITRQGADREALENMNWVWGQGRENVESSVSFDILVQYLWGTRTWWDVAKGIVGVAGAIATGQPEALAPIVINQSTQADPQGAKNHLRDVHGDDAGARGSYDRLYGAAGQDAFFGAFVSCGLQRPNWARVEANLKWQCENNPISSVSAHHTFLKIQGNPSGPNGVVTRIAVIALYWLHSGQFHNDGARITYRQAARTDFSRLFQTLGTQIRATGAAQRAAEIARRRREAMELREPHPGRIDGDRIYRR
ncbi:MAG TPA: hypothetical protein VN700_16870 [Vicinamibacterales bacterium]|nr:hypothetical protein [Vicinamibacterales bacterium]